MQIFEYRALFEPGERKGTLVVSFPDVPEAITQGKGEVQARANAEEALGLALLSYPAPRAGAAQAARTRLPIAADRRRAGDRSEAGASGSDPRVRDSSESAFARLIGRDEKEARRILDPLHSTRLSTLSDALRALGQQMVIKTEKLPQMVAPERTTP